MGPQGDGGDPVSFLLNNHDILKLFVPIRVLLDHLVPKEELVYLVYLGNLVNLAVMGILDLQEDLANLESVVYLECLEFQVQKVTEDFLVLMVQKETQDHLVKREKMELLV